MDPFREAPPNLLTDNLSNQVRALRKQVNELIDANAKLGVRITELESLSLEKFALGYCLPQGKPL